MRAKISFFFLGKYGNNDDDCDNGEQLSWLRNCNEKEEEAIKMETTDKKKKKIVGMKVQSGAKKKGFSRRGWSPTIKALIWAAIMITTMAQTGKLGHHRALQTTTSRQVFFGTSCLQHVARVTKRAMGVISQGNKMRGALQR